MINMCVIAVMWCSMNVCYLIIGYIIVRFIKLGTGLQLEEHCMLDELKKGTFLDISA